jgi:hypothetical protein
MAFAPLEARGWRLEATLLSVVRGQLSVGEGIGHGAQGCLLIPDPLPLIPKPYLASQLLERAER